jgi:hypothetical protein
VSFFWGTGLVLLMFSCNRFFAACDAHETIYECWAYATAHDAIYMRCQMFELHMIPNYEFNYVSMLLYLLLSLPPYSTTTTLYLLHGTARLGLLFWWASLWHMQWCEKFYAEAAAMMMKCPHFYLWAAKLGWLVYHIQATSLIDMWLQWWKSEPNIVLKLSHTYSTLLFADPSLFSCTSSFGSG